MYEEGSVASTAGDEEYCLSRLRRRYSAEKNGMYKGCFKGLAIGVLAFLSFFLTDGES